MILSTGFAVVALMSIEKGHHPFLHSTQDRGQPQVFLDIIAYYTKAYFLLH